MKKKKIYILTANTRGSIYGVGTYVSQLIICLKQAKVEFEIVNLYSNISEVIIEEMDGYKQIYIPFVGSANKSSYYFRNVVYLLREFIPTESDYSYIFHLNIRTSVRFVQLLKNAFNCRIVLTVHYSKWSFDLLGNKKQLIDILTKKRNKLDPFEKKVRNEFEEDIKIMEVCDQFIYVANHSSNMYSYYISKNKGIIINNGLKDTFKELSPERKNSIKNKYLIETKSRIVIFAGRLDSVKGVNFLIKSFKKVLKTHPDTFLIIAGDGDFSSLLRIQEYYWTRIIFTGLIAKKKLYELYKIADIGVVSSIHEEFGYVTIEMMMHTLPIIVSDVGGLSEIIEDNVSGLKVPVVTNKGNRCLNVEQLSKKICLLLEDIDFAEHIGKGGRARFLEKYELSVFKKNIIALYNTI